MSAPTGWARALLLAAAVVAAGALAGCSDDGGKKKEEVVPGEITREDVDRLDRLVTEAHPRFFSFPGQSLLPSTALYFNDTVAPGTGSTGVETPTDDGPTDYGADYILYDVSDPVPMGQPVEIRMKLKWYGNPGASADLDIWANVPGTHDAYSPGRYDESWNWNIVTKVRVVNTVHLEGQPFEVGIQVTNGKEIHPDGMAYEFTVELVFGHNVLAPGVPYRVSVPEGASGLIFESEPLVGDEHIDSEVLLIDPNENLERHFTHNDIVSETLFMPVSGPGDYVLYASHMRGGFLRVQTDVPNPQANASLLQTTTTEEVVAQDVVLAPNAPGASALALAGSFDAGATFPLDITPFIRTDGAAPAGFSGQVSLNISSSQGWVATAEVTGGGGGADGRVGGATLVLYDRSHLATGPYDWVLTGNGGIAVDVGYTLMTYVR